MNSPDSHDHWPDPAKRVLSGERVALLTKPAHVLRRSTQVLQDPQIRLVGVSLAGAGLGKVAIFAALTALAWVTPTVAFAVFAAQWLAVQSIAGIFTSSAANSTASYSAREALQQSGLRTQDLRLPSRFALRGGLAGALTLAPATHLLTGQSWDPALVGIGLGIGAIVYLDGLLGVLAGKGSSSQVAVIEASRGLFAVPTVLLLATSVGPTAAVAGLVGVDAVIGASLTIRAFCAKSQEIGVPSAPHAHNADSGAMRIARAGTFANLVTQAGLYGFNAILSHGYGLAALAAFSVANRFASLAILLPTMLTKNMLGLLTRSAMQDGDRYARELRRYITHVVLLAVLAGAAAVAASLTIFGSLFEKYPLATTLLAIIVLASIPSAIGSALGIACVVKGNLKTWVFSDVAFMAILLVWALGASQLHGSAALVALGILAAYLTSTAIRAWRILKG